MLFELWFVSNSRVLLGFLGGNIFFQLFVFNVGLWVVGMMLFWISFYFPPIFGVFLAI